MSKMKIGTATSLKDFNTLATIHVGDLVKDLDSSLICRINAYGQAIDQYGGDHTKGRLAIFKVENDEARLQYLRETEDKEIEDKQTSEESTSSTQNPSPVVVVSPLESVPDKELAEALRARGYTVTATKTVTIEL